MRCSCFGGPSAYKKKGSAAESLHGIDDDLLQDINHISYNELRSATDNFASSNIIGRGGFGIVYKGILRSRIQVAVKTLSAQSKQGVREFLNEIKTISNLKHPNLVELVGCCVQGANRILVYEYLENNSLDYALLDNVTHISTRIAGTTGYLAPEYALGGQLTMKADVYSFGVLILEIISGRNSTKPGGGGMDKLLLEWAWQLHEEGRPLELVDREMGEFPEEEVIRYIKVAFFCTQSAANRRPLMSQVVEMLSKQIRLNDELLTAPGCFRDSEGTSGGPSSMKKFSAESTSYQMSSVPVTITEVTPR
ncbi:hypothetical protein DKX38_005537 [Salix brachista]|uniref:Protein kinase domain-containing protein n=1 Tax=Salix brachista TaxID=2182728 RepID=A0A5N5MZN9_9ROSI|nr:hypothetical protein DKX38_005537 [Salix brachista]